MKRKVFASVGLAMALVAFGSQEVLAAKKIGMLLFSGEARYTESKDSVIAQLKKEGFAAPDTTFIIENAEGNKSKAAEIAKNFTGMHLDLVMAFGTSAVTPMAKEITVTPVVFGYVFDPVESKIVADWKNSGNNVTGVSNKVDMANLLATFKKLSPVKTLGVLYTPGEKNSEIQLKDLQAVQGATGVKIVPVPVTKKEDIQSVVAEAAAAMDALYITGSGIIGLEIPAVVALANKAGKPTVTHLDDQVAKGVLMAVSASAGDIGTQVGEMAVRVLKGEKPSAIPIGLPKSLDILLNMKTAKQFTIPAEFMKMVTKKID